MKMKDKETIIQDDQIKDVPKKDEKPGFFKKLIGIAGSIAPTVANLVAPGSGHLVKGVLSTLNDDEWFSEFKGNGAAFNELLQFAKNPAGMELRDAEGNLVTESFTSNAELALIYTRINNTKSFTDNFMPSVLAYVRDKTKNVLNDDVNLYTATFLNEITIVALYYTLKKFYNLALNIPTNAPKITSAIEVLKPANLSGLYGIIDSLEGYIKSTIRLPYALNEYIRWRFGTLFCSSNTGRPGFVAYVPTMVYFDPTRVDNVNVWEGYLTAEEGYAVSYFSDGWISEVTPAKLGEYIELLKSNISRGGRACADFYTAYADHTQRLDVEDRHYDEKEYNLRQNYNSVLMPRCNTATEVVMDSRLDMNAALQAVTISTAQASQYKVTGSGSSTVIGWKGKAFGLTPFVVEFEEIFFETVNTPNINWENDHTMFFNTNTGTIIERNNLIVVSMGNGTFKLRLYNTPRVAIWAAPMNEIALTNLQASAQEAIKRNNTNALYMLLTNSLEMHVNRSMPLYIPNALTTNSFIPLMSNPLSYDRAILADSSVESIQRNAILNLVRGAYKNKTPETIKEDVKEIIDVATKDSVKVE